MNDHTAVIDRIRVAAERIEVAHDLERVTERTPPTSG